MGRRFNVTCRECSYTDDHADWCVSRGYAAVGPHPDAPAPETVRAPQTAPLEMCCGGVAVRALCTYHGPSAVTASVKSASLPDGYAMWDDGTVVNEYGEPVGHISLYA